ncbi:MAG TPA: FUSC family protein [Burkholderiales bacterium]|nr:FUSC family protein [Burkholderiales bacterium]
MAISFKPLHSDSIPNAVLLALRASLASVLAVGTTRLLHLAYPIYALIAAVIVTDASNTTTRKLGGYRILGTAFGALFGAFLSVYLEHSLLAIGLGVGVMVMLLVLAGFNEAAKLAGYVAALVVLDHSSQPWIYALDRFIETTLGIIAAIAVSYCIPGSTKTSKTPK